MLRLQVSAQNYDWGRIGEESEVGRLYGISSGKEVQHDVPYAELWMGTHPSGPSFISDAAVGGEPQLLKDWLLEHHEALGDDVFKHWQGELPFLFKVCARALLLARCIQLEISNFIKSCRGPEKPVLSLGSPFPLSSTGQGDSICHPAPFYERNCQDEGNWRWCSEIDDERMGLPLSVLLLLASRNFRVVSSVGAVFDSRFEDSTR